MDFQARKGHHVKPDDSFGQTFVITRQAVINLGQEEATRRERTYYMATTVRVEDSLAATLRELSSEERRPGAARFIAAIQAASLKPEEITRFSKQLPGLPTIPARIEQIAQTVPGEVESQHQEKDGHSRKDGEPYGFPQIAATSGKIGSPRRSRRLRA